MSHITEYQRLLARVLVARREHADEEVEDRLLDQMDAVWARMSPSDRVLAERISNELASGILTEDAFIAHTLPQPSSRANEMDIYIEPSLTGVAAPARVVPVSTNAFASNTVELLPPPFSRQVRHHVEPRFTRIPERNPLWINFVMEIFRLEILPGNRTDLHITNDARDSEKSASILGWEKVEA